MCRKERERKRAGTSFFLQFEREVAEDGVFGDALPGKVEGLVGGGGDRHDEEVGELVVLLHQQRRGLGVEVGAGGAEVPVPQGAHEAGVFFGREEVARVLGVLEEGRARALVLGESGWPGRFGL